MREVDEEEAAELANGKTRGLEYGGSPWPRGLGDGDGLKCAIADGDGGRRSVIPNRCSTVKDGICATLSDQADCMGT